MSNFNSLKQPIAILGGTFDPVHNGHLRLAVQLLEQLQLAEVLLVPCARPSHRDQPIAQPGQRAKWLRVATALQEGLHLDDRELMREGPSYTIDTLMELREERPDTPLCLAMGTDVFAKLDRWHRWEELLDYAHLVVVPRPGLGDFVVPEKMQALLNRCGTSNVQDLSNTLHGRVYEAELPPLKISGSDIRHLLAAKCSAQYLVPEVVLDEITEQGIYNPQ